MIALPELIDHAMPFGSACGICGGPDSRHRILDAVAGVMSAGDGAEETALDFGLTVDVVEQIAEHWSWVAQRWLERQHVPEVMTYKNSPPWSEARCSCGWRETYRYRWPNSAGRAWRRHLERAK